MRITLAHWIQSPEPCRGCLEWGVPLKLPVQQHQHVCLPRPFQQAMFHCEWCPVHQDACRATLWQCPPAIAEVFEPVPATLFTSALSWHSRHSLASSADLLKSSLSRAAARCIWCWRKAHSHHTSSTAKGDGLSSNSLAPPLVCSTRRHFIALPMCAEGPSPPSSAHIPSTLNAECIARSTGFCSRPTHPLPLPTRRCWLLYALTPCLGPYA